MAVKPVISSGALAPAKAMAWVVALEVENAVAKAAALAVEKAEALAVAKAEAKENTG